MASQKLRLMQRMEELREVAADAMNEEEEAKRGFEGVKSKVEDYFIAEYPKSNWDQIQLDIDLIEPKPKYTGDDVIIKPKNLYTFMLCCGISVLYCDWIYEDKFVIEEHVYFYDKLWKEYRILTAWDYKYLVEQASKEERKKELEEEKLRRTLS